MSGETGQLQRLSDEQVKNRLAAYNPGGALDRDIEMLRENAADIIATEVIAQFGPQRAERLAQNYAGKVDADWIQNVAEYGRQIVRCGESGRGLVAAMASPLKARPVAAQVSQVRLTGS